MSRVTSVPAETDLLCENCGYVLNGLPDNGRCPECGKPTSDSSPQRRSLPAWEAARGGLWRRPTAFITTSAEVLFRPTRFYRTLAVHDETRQAFAFAQLHWAASAALFGW